MTVWENPAVCRLRQVAAQLKVVLPVSFFEEECPHKASLVRLGILTCETGSQSELVRKRVVFARYIEIFWFFIERWRMYGTGVDGGGSADVLQPLQGGESGGGGRHGIVGHVPRPLEEAHRQHHLQLSRHLAQPAHRRIRLRAHHRVRQHAPLAALHAGPRRGQCGAGSCS